MNRRDFVIGAVSGAAGTGVLGFATGLARGRKSPDATCPPPNARLSFSQQGEDLILYSLLHEHMKLAQPTYLDIGAGDPVLSNNTYLLYCTGSRGVLVEPNPTLADRLEATRPGDTVVRAGVGVTDAAEADYYVIRGQPSLNTFSLEQVEMHRRGAGHDVVEKVMKMPLIGVNRLIRERLGRAPDLLSIDIEGLDLAVLRTLDYEHLRPGAIIVETIQGNRINPDILALLTEKGYAVRGGSFINTIFVDPGRLA
jgi:FkbM family methyltransferase